MTPAQLSKTSLKFLLKELVQMPTLTTEKATSRAALDWIKYQVRDLPLHVTDFENNGYAALLLTTRPTKHPKVLLSAHIDVAPAPIKDFALREEGGRYYGRGVFDMKYAIAVYMRLLLELGDELPNYDLGVVLTSDEEDTGGLYGAKPLTEAGWGADVVIDPDAIAGWAIQSEAKGLIRFRVQSQGESGHGSRPWEYRNAITQLMDYLSDLGARFTPEPCGDSLHRHTTLTVGTIQGGQAINQVPASAQAGLDIRIPPGHTTAQTDQLLHEVAVNHPGITLEHLAGEEPFELDTSSPYAQRLQSLMQEVVGRRAEFIMAHGSSEASHYAAKGIPVLVFEGPGGGHHSDGEWIDIKGIGQFAEIIRRFVEQEARA
jgi:acetylornithine deacetylase/succinyl-diaminopimelate desuccinylase-like protein